MSCFAIGFLCLVGLGALVRWSKLGAEDNIIGMLASIFMISWWVATLLTGSIAGLVAYIIMSMTLGALMVTSPSAERKAWRGTSIGTKLLAYIIAPPLTVGLFALFQWLR